MPRVVALSGLRPDPSDPDRTLVTRFANGDSTAFAALMDRHGPLVLGVCRRALGGSPLADDAFQATFLVLAQKARGLRNPDGLSSWLFGVARRVALAARRKEARHAQAVRDSARRPDEKPQAAEWDDLLCVVDEELERLPEKQRAAVLLCLYHGKTQDEAAATLGWSLSTLRRRLDEGRELLKARLTSRGATLGVGLLAGTLAPSASASVSPELAAETLDLSTGSLVGGTVPVSIESLATQGVVMSSTVKFGAIVAGLLLSGTAIGAAWWFWQPVVAPPPPENPPVAMVPGPMPPEPLANPWVEPLPQRAVARLGTTAFRHGSGGAFGIVDPLGVTQLGFLPDGTLVSIGGGRVRFWQPSNGQELHRDGPALRRGWAG